MSGGHTLHAAGVAGAPASPIHRLDPRAKLIGFAGLTVVAVSTPLQAWPVYVACGLALAVIARLARVRAKTVWSRARVAARPVWPRARVVLPLVLFVALFPPSARRGDPLDLGPVAVSRQGLET